MKLELLQITEKKEAQFNRAGIYTVEDLLETWPKKYIDAREPVRIDDAEDGGVCRVEGELIYIRKAPKCSYFILSERTSLRHLKVLFFHSDYRLDSLHRGDIISVVGKFSLESYGAMNPSSSATRNTCASTPAVFHGSFLYTGKSRECPRSTMRHA